MTTSPQPHPLSVEHHMAAARLAGVSPAALAAASPAGLTLLELRAFVAAADDLDLPDTLPLDECGHTDDGRPALLSVQLPVKQETITLHVHAPEEGEDPPQGPPAPPAAPALAADRRAPARVRRIARKRAGTVAPHAMSVPVTAGVLHIDSPPAGMPTALRDALQRSFDRRPSLSYGAR